MASANTPAQKPAHNELYAETVKIQPRSIKGTFRSLKWAAVWILLAIYHFSPFLRWDRGVGAPDQAILIDMGGRRAYFFGIEIWPQEVYYITGLLAFAAIALFLMSALAGRLWCGFGCWQTVYTDLFMGIERWVLGDRNVRIKFDRRPLMVRLPKQMVVWTAWFAVAAACGIGFTLYFGDAFEMLRDIFTLNSDMAVYGTIGVVGGMCFLLAGWGREQICIYMCPYSRFQAAMFDEHSLLVSYEGWRGEPRGGAKKGQDFTGRGHCVDCKMCVQVCPTGIDIREGSQLACIGCALCVDACNSIMDKFGLPRGLISWDSTANTEARAKGEAAKYRIIRPRTLVYGAVVAIIGGVMLFALGTRHTMEVNILHERTPLYVQLSDGSLRNGYTYKVLNMVRKDRSLTLTTDGLPGATIEVVGGETGPSVHLDVAGDQVGTFRIYVSAPADSSKGKATEFRLLLTETEGDKPVRVVSETMFAGPER